MPRPRKNTVRADWDVSQSPIHQGDGNQTVNYIHNYGTTETPQRVVSWSGRPRPDETSFFGRDTDLLELGKQFASGSGAVISGSAGTGKSRLATEWSEASGTKGIWSQGGATVERTFAATAGLLSIDAIGKDDEQLAEEAKHRLSLLPVGTVWTIDDLASVKQVPELLAGCGALKMLITSRDGNLNRLPPGMGKLPLEAIDTDPAVEMLCSRGGSGERQVLEELAAAVGYLPLALEMLAARLGKSMARGV